MEYGVSTQNKFAFLGDDEEVTDPEEVLQRAEKESKEKVVKGKDVKKPVLPEKKVTISQPSANKENVDGRRGPPRRDQKPRGPGGADGFKGRRENRGPRRSTGDENAPPGDVMADRFGENRPARDRNFNQNRRSKDGEHGGDNERGFKKYDRPPRQPRSGDNYVSDSDGQQGNRPPRGDRPFRGSRGPRGPRGGDRHSHDPKTGVRPGAGKKGGHGSNNWGTEQDDLAAETQPNQTDDWGSSPQKAPEHTEPANTDDWGAPAADNQDAPQEATDENQEVNGEKAEEKAEKVLTLKEWKEQQKQNQAQFNVRKAGEGGDQKIYQKLVPIKKEKVDKDANTTEDEDEHQLKREPREKPLNIAISFTTSDHKRGGHREDRGPRGEHREDRGHRGDRGPRPDRGEGAPRGGGGGGGRGGGPRRQHNPDAPSGSGRRQNQGGRDFNLAQESFPALGAR